MSYNGNDRAPAPRFAGDRMAQRARDSFRVYNDSELGPLPTCPDCSRVLVSGDPHYCDGIPQAFWPWVFAAIGIGAASALILLAIIFHRLAQPNPPTHPVIESHK